MPTFRCLFCQHANPASAKFCNECGSGLHLQPCERCDAINDRNAPQCHHCGVALAAAPSEPAREASEPAAVPTLVDEVTLPKSAVSAEQLTSVDRAFEVLERDLATLDRTRAAGRAGDAPAWAVATQPHEHAATGGEGELAAVRLQPFWRLRASRPRARSLATMAAAGVVVAVAVAGYLHTLPQGPTPGTVAATTTQPVRELAIAPSVDSSAMPNADPAARAPAVTAKRDDPVPAPAVAAKQDDLVPAPAVAAKQDDPIPAPAVAAKQDDPPAAAVVAKPDDPTPTSAVGSAIAPALMAQADDPAASAPARPVTAKPRRARTSTARAVTVSPPLIDSVPTTAAPGIGAVSPSPVAGPCTASVAALGLCARGPDAADR
ncbi:MAG: double zinc ribbon domain-containing protein [Betaproteobacteria bacterium]